MRLAVLSVLALSSLSSCFSEPPADRVWRCTTDKPLCPQGQRCVNDWCVQEGTAQPDMSVTADGSGTSDMTTKPCSDGFPIGTQGVWACRGKFSPASPASTLCLNGYKPCANASKLTDAECSSTDIKGIFLSTQAAQGSGSAGARCVTTPPASNAGSMWYGCGWEQSRKLTERAGMACQGFPLVHFCEIRIGFPCNLGEVRLDLQTNENPQHGVLCCPP